jgi:hypothetical protein
MGLALAVVHFKNAVDFQLDHLLALVKLILFFFLFVQIMHPPQHHLHFNFWFLQNAR